MLAGATPLAFVAARFALAALILLPFVWREVRSGGKTLLVGSLWLGLLGGASYALQTLGMTTTTASNSGFITGTAVIMVPFFDRALRKTPLAVPAMLGAFLALIGMYVLAGLDDPSELLAGRIGDLWTLISAVFYALYIVLLQAWLARLGHRPLLAGQLVVIAVAAALCAPVIEKPALPLAPAVLLSLAFCAPLATVWAGLLQLKCQRDTTPARAALIYAMEPVFAALFAAVLLGEALGAATLIGGLLIVLGVIVSEVGATLRSGRLSAE